MFLWGNLESWQGRKDGASLHEAPHPVVGEAGPLHTAASGSLTATPVCTCFSHLCLQCMQECPVSRSRSRVQPSLKGWRNRPHCLWWENLHCPITRGAHTRLEKFWATSRSSTDAILNILSNTAMHTYPIIDTGYIPKRWTNYSINIGTFYFLNLFYWLCYYSHPNFPPLLPSAQYLHSLQQSLLQFLNMGCAWKLFGFSISHTILDILYFVSTNYAS